MPISVEIRTTCENCKDPLPLNAWSTAVTCWSCLHENPISPEHWAQLLKGALDDGWTLDEGEGRTENLEVGRRKFELRFSGAKKPKGKVRPRPKEMRAELFPGVVGTVGEETAVPATTENLPFKCPQCAAALTIDGRSRNVDCGYCHATTQIADDAWRRIHPLHAQRAWILVLEDDGLGVAPAAKEAPSSPQFRVLDVAAGRDGLYYAAVEFEKRALVCMDADLRIRWRTDVKGRDALFAWVAVVGDEVWWVDNSKHEARRFARADGSALGKIGGEEPVGAKVHHLDLKGSTDLVGCSDGTVLALVAWRLVRYDAQGRGILTWPPLGCLWGLLWGEKLRPLYAGPQYEEDADFSDSPFVGRPTTTERAGGMADQFGQARPVYVVSVQTRAVAAADGSVWLFDGTRLARYARDGKCRWVARLEGAEAALNVRPGLDGDLNAYVVAMTRKEKVALYRVSPDGKVKLLTDHGVGHPSALAVTPEGRVLVFGNNAGELRIFDKDGAPVRASHAAIEADRYAAEDAYQEEDEDLDA